MVIIIIMVLGRRPRIASTCARRVEEVATVLVVSALQLRWRTHLRFSLPSLPLGIQKQGFPLMVRPRSGLR